MQRTILIEQKRKKLLSLLLVAMALLCSASVYAEVGKGYVTFKTNKFIKGSEKKLGFRVTILIGRKVITDPDDTTTAPAIGEDITVEGGELELTRPKGEADQEFNLWVKAPQVTIHGDLVELTIANGDVTEVDISHCPTLYSLRVTDNKNLQKLDIGTNPKLGQLWASYCPNITSLDLSNSPNLNSLSIQGTRISQIDLTKVPLLTNLNAGENPNLKKIDVTHLPLLNELWVNGNGMTELDVSHNPKLERLECSCNYLKHLTVENNPLLNYLACWQNAIEGKEMDNLISSLPKEENGAERELLVYNKNVKYNNICTEEQVNKIQSEKCWTAKEAIPLCLSDNECFIDWDVYAGATNEEAKKMHEQNLMVTGINVIHATKQYNNQDWYDLQGRHLQTQPTMKGIYIHNGKKVIID